MARSFENQFFFGDDLLVAPCIQPGGQVEVYLPAGRWRRFPGGTVLEGGRTFELKLALDETAVFARDGAVIPLGPAVRHTGELAGGGPRPAGSGGAPSGAVSTGGLR
jgi:alpha-D-xyloside xylohydrolase